jgi:hypothetical protein
MKAPKEMDFVERRNAASAARRQLVEKMQRAPKANDPLVIASRAERAGLKAANAAQRSERIALKEEADVRQKAEEDARQRAEALAAKAELDATAARSAAEKAEQKAERDRRYAARKNRNR